MVVCTAIVITVELASAVIEVIVSVASGEDACAIGALTGSVVERALLVVCAAVFEGIDFALSAIFVVSGIA